MATVRAAVTGVDNIVRVYESISGNSPFYSVWFNNAVPAFQWNENDRQGGIDYLRDNLTMLADTGDNAVYSIRIHPEQSDCYTAHSKVKVTSSMPIRLNALEDSDVINGVPATYARGENILLAFMREQFSAMNERLIKIETIEPEPKEEVDTFGRIMGFVENPATQPVVIGLINALAPMIAKIIPGMAVPAVSQNNAITDRGFAINGTNESELLMNEQDEVKLNDALDRLEKHCDLVADLTALANLAESNPAMFSMLLTQLRNQK